MRSPAAGLSYVEVMVALVLLGICALPAADAIRAGLRAGEVGAVQARELRCVKSRMETVLAESYDELWKAQQGTDTPSSYSLAADAECGVRNVFIARYVHPYGDLTGQVLDAANPTADTLLIVTVSGTDGAYPLTTLVDR